MQERLGHQVAVLDSHMESRATIMWAMIVLSVLVLNLAPSVRGIEVDAATPKTMRAGETVSLRTFVHSGGQGYYRLYICGSLYCPYSSPYRKVAVDSYKYLNAGHNDYLWRSAQTMTQGHYYFCIEDALQFGDYACSRSFHVETHLDGDAHVENYFFYDDLADDDDTFNNDDIYNSDDDPVEESLVDASLGLGVVAGTALLVGSCCFCVREIGGTIAMSRTGTFNEDGMIISSGGPTTLPVSTILSHPQGASTTPTPTDNAVAQARAGPLQSPVAPALVPAAPQSRPLGAADKRGDGVFAAIWKEPHCFGISMTLGNVAIILFLVTAPYFAGIIVVPVLVYLALAYHAKVRRHLDGGFHDKGQLDNFVKHMVEHCPAALRWNVVCYHYETRSSTDSQGHTTTSTVRVNTHAAQETWHCTSATDLSDPFEDLQLDRWDLVALEIPKVYLFADSATKEAHDVAARLFRVANNRDTHQDFTVTLDINGHKPAIVTTTTRSGSHPWWMNSCCYWFTVCVCCWVPFSYCFLARVHSATWRVRKVMYLQPAASAAPIVMELPGQQSAAAPVHAAQPTAPYTMPGPVAAGSSVATVVSAQPVPGTQELVTISTQQRVEIVNSAAMTVQEYDTTMTGGDQEGDKDRKDSKMVDEYKL